MASRNIIFVAFQDQPNLGIGYMASVLLGERFDVEVLDFRLGSQEILERVQKAEPLLVGFSVIFQYYTPEYAELASYLRGHGVTCLICAGGHYPSLQYEEALDLMRDVDCIVRFEGEDTLAEIAHRLSEGRDWRDIRSLAYRAGGQIVATPLRPLIADLDRLPFPKRWNFDYQCLGIRATSLLASRGCVRNCTFCSIRRFYSIPPGGGLRRTRSPENVVEEMLELYRDHDVRIFLFQDDDFSMMSPRDRDWVGGFLQRLARTEMADSIMWKISCRADEVEERLFGKLKAAGMWLVYLGIESGNSEGLRVLNKQISVEQNRRALGLLKGLGVRYDFGFMLFDPSSTFETVRENVRFLREICLDGSATASFGKTLPYAGTDLERQMRQEGRLSGDVSFPNYSFSDGRVEAWFGYLCEVFYPWVYGGQCLQAQLRWSLFESEVLGRFHKEIPGIGGYVDMLTYLVRWYNTIFCNIVEDSAEIFELEVGYNADGRQALKAAAERQRLWIEDQLARQRRAFFTKTRIPLELVTGKIEESRTPG